MILAPRDFYVFNYEIQKSKEYHPSELKQKLMTKVYTEEADIFKMFKMNDKIVLMSKYVQSDPHLTNMNSCFNHAETQKFYENVFANLKHKNETTTVEL